MSTKIYTAYKVVPPKGKTFTDVLFDIQKKGRKNVIGKFVSLYGNSNFFKNSRELKLKYIESQKTLQRSIFDFSVHITAREWKKKWYLIPYCESASLLRGSLDFLDKHPNLVDFGYWNNTDRPENVTSRQWNTRRKVWDEIFEKWEESITVDIFSLNTWESVHNEVFEKLRKGKSQEELLKLLDVEEGDDNDSSNNNLLQRLLECE